MLNLTISSVIRITVVKVTVHLIKILFLSNSNNKKMLGLDDMKLFMYLIEQLIILIDGKIVL